VQGIVGGDPLLETRAVEACPISNQVLQYVQDIRNHPAVAMLTAGVPLTLSPDDPAPLGYDSVTYDWWVAVVAWEIDLVGVKQLALNSIRFSALDSKGKAVLNASFAAAWAKWIGKHQ
jgi:adenosine deaminase CECR1